jgi:gliding motility-associated-like protein
MGRILLFLLLLFPIYSSAQTISYSGTLSICDGESKVFSIADAAGATNFQWFKDNNPISSANGNTFSASASGTYKVSMIISGNTVTTPDVTLVVNTNPTAGFTISSQNDCANTNTTFTSTSTGSALTYLWNFGDPSSGTGNSSTVQNPVKSFLGTPGTGNQTFNVLLTVTDGNGCSNSITQPVVKKQLPGTQMNGTGSKVYDGKDYFTYCSSGGGSMSFTNNSSTSGSNTNYKIVWGNGSPDYDAPSFPLQTQTYSNGVSTMTFTVTGSNGCIATVNKYIFVGTNPAVGIANPGGTNVCTGQTLTFPISSTSSNTPGTTYTVDFHDGSAPIIYNHPAPTDVSHVFNTNSCGFTNQGYTNSFYVSIIAANACQTTTALAVPIYVSQKPVADFTISPSSNVCANTVVTFSGNASLAKAAASDGCKTAKSVWTISPSSGFTIQSGSSLGSDNGSSDFDLWSAGSDNISLRFTTPGTYTIKLKLGNGAVCGNDEITKTICVSAGPTASFTVDQNTGCAPFNVKTTNTSSLATCGTNSYSWNVSYTASGSCTPNTSGVSYISGSPTSTNPEFSFTNPGTYTIGLTNTYSSGCTSTQATQVIIVKSKPTFSVSSWPSSICAGTISPQATSANCNGSTGPAYSWSFSGGSPATSNTANAGTINYLTPGNYIVQLDVSNECGANTITRTLEVKAKPDVTVPANSMICAGSASGVLTFSSSTPGSIFSWTNNNTGTGLTSSGNGATINSFTGINTGGSPISSTITVTPSAAGCTGTAGSFSITVNPKPSPPTVSSPVNYCEGATTAQLSATATGGNTLTWYNNIGLTGGTATAPTPSSSSGGSSSYFVTQQNSYSCISNASSIIVNVTSAITSNSISNDQTICASSAAGTLLGTTPGGGTGSFSYQWESSSDGITWNNASGSSVSLNYSPGNLNSTTYFRRKVSSGACFNNISNPVLITVQPGLTNTGITANQSICQGNTPALLNGSTPSGGTGSYTYTWESSLNNSTWSNISGAAAIDYQPPALNNTTYYRRTVNSGTCNATSTVLISVTNSITNNTISSNQTICAGSGTAAISGAPLGGGNGSFSYQWQSSSDGTSWSNVTSGGNSGTYNAGSIVTTTLYRRMVSSGACLSSPSNTVTITVQPALQNTSIGSDQDICENNPSALLTGNLPTGGTGTFTYAWQSSTDNATWTSISSSNTKDYQPPVLHTTTYYRRTVTSGLCNVTSPSVKLTVYNTPSAGTLSQSSVNTCFGSTVSLSTTGYLGTIQKWEYSFTPSNSSSWITATSTSNNISFPNVQQDFSVRVTVVQNGGCGNISTSPEVPVFVSAPTVAGTTGNDATVCINTNSGTISLSGQTGSVSRWESSLNNSTWTSITNTNTSLNFSGLTTTTYYRAVVKNGACPSANSSATKITVVPNVTTSNAGTDQALCAQSTLTLNGNNPSVGTGIWSQTGGLPVTITNPSARNSQVTGLLPGQSYKFTWLITGPGCPSSSDEMQVVNTPPITIANAGPDQVICTFIGPKDSIILTGNTPTNTSYETGTWTISNGSPTGSNPIIRATSNPLSRFVFDKAGTYTLNWQITNGACPNTNDQLIINVFDKPVVGPLTPSASIGCVGNDILISSGSSLRGQIMKWQYNFSTVTSPVWTDTSITTPSLLFSNVQKSFNVRLITRSAGISMGCSLTDTSSIPIEIIPDFNNEIDTTELAVCPGQSISIAGQLPSGAYNVFQYQWQQSKDGKTGWTDIAGQTFTNLNIIPLASAYVRRIVSVAPCSKPSKIAYVYVRPSVGNFLMSDSVGTCFPFDVTFTNLVLPSTKTTWNFGDGAFDEGDEVRHTYRSTGSFTVIMTAQYPGGCRFEATKNVFIQGPKGILKNELTGICINEPVRFEVAAPGVDSIRWSFGDGQSMVTTEKIVYHQYKAAGPYYPNVDLLAGADGKCRTRINSSDSIYVDDVKSDFTQTILQDCGSTRVSFTDKSTAFYGLKKFYWEFGDQKISNLQHPTTIYSGTNNWTILHITEGNSGCRDTVIKKIPIQVWDIPKINTNKDSVACVGQTIPFAAYVYANDGIKNSVWNFSHGPINNNLTAPMVYSFPGKYLTTFIATTNNNCSDTVRLPITVYPKPQIQLEPDTTLATGTRFPLNSIVKDGPITRWEWIPNRDIDCNNCALPIATIKNKITYSVKGYTDHNCLAVDTININVFCAGSQVFVPNVFTPDGDGLNDILMVRASGIRIVKSFRIYNRWGEIVFEKSNFQPNDRSSGWDGLIKGVKASPDVYIYTYEVICENNETYFKKGNVTLIK